VKSILLILLISTAYGQTLPPIDTIERDEKIDKIEEQDRELTDFHYENYDIKSEELNRQIKDQQLNPMEGKSLTGLE
jgi:hypothetical protein